MRDVFQEKLNRAWSGLVDFPLQAIDSVTLPQFHNTKKNSIPKVVYQTWETFELGRRHKKSRSHFVKMNPDFRFEVFDRAGRDQYMRELWGSHEIFQAYKHAVFGPMKADIFRYCILYERGGYYFDISKGLNRPISDVLLDGASELLTVENHPWHSEWGELSDRTIQITKGRLLLQWGLGSAPNHVLLSRMIRNISDNYLSYANVEFKNPKFAILQLTGPIAFTRALNLALEEAPDTSVSVIDEPDFAGAGIYSLRGSGARHRTVPSYVHSGTSKIIEIEI